MSGWCGYDPSISQMHSNFGHTSRDFLHLDKHFGNCNLSVDDSKFKETPTNMNISKTIPKGLAIFESDFHAKTQQTAPIADASSVSVESEKPSIKPLEQLDKFLDTTDTAIKDSLSVDTVVETQSKELSVSKYKCGTDSNICFKKESDKITSYCVVPKDISCDDPKVNDFCSGSNLRMLSDFAL